MYIVINIIQSIFLYLYSLIVVFGFMVWMPKNAIFFFANYVWTPGGLFISGARTIVTGRENLDQKKYYIFMANHSSWADIPCMYKATGRQLRFIAKMELSRHFILGPIMRRMQMIFIDRSNPKKSATSMRIAVEQIKQGRDIVIFPEGTRTKTGKINNFKRGGFKLAIDAEAEIVPVSIKNSGNVWPRNNFSFRRGTIEIKIGKPISTIGFTEENANLLSEQVKTQIEKQLSS